MAVRQGGLPFRGIGKALSSFREQGERRREANLIAAERTAEHSARQTALRGEERLRADFEREAIPEGIFTVVPSAELSAQQAVDEGKGDPLVYPYHDRLFFAWVQRWNRATPEEILEWYAAGTLNSELGLDPSVTDVYRLFPDPAAFVRDLERWWNLYNGIAVAKRVQAPPILAVSSRAFGFDHREALGKPFYSARYRELRARLAGNA